MIEINFGLSDYSRWRPGEDNIIRVPEKGEIIRTPQGKELPPEASELPKFGKVVKDERAQALSTSWTVYSPPYNYGPKGYEFSDYDEIMKLEPHLDVIQGYPSVIISQSRSKMSGEDIELLMLWIEKRGEWIVIWHRKWLESVYDDECFDGPFALDEMCSRKILQAYRVPEEKLRLDEVRQTGPERLKHNSQSF